MKVLLVNPQFPNTFWSFRNALWFDGKRSAFPPLGLLTVSALLPKSWERRLVDLEVRALKQADIDWADIVFVTAMLIQKDSLKRVVKMCKARGKRVALGGPYVTTTVEELPEADHIFLGEAETSLQEFISDLEDGTLKRIYKAPERPPLTMTPTAHYGLADIKRYSAMSVQYSRGCPFQCEFCDIIEIYGRNPRTKSNEQMLSELEALQSAGWHGTVFIVDDNFIGNKRNVKQLLPALIDWQEKNNRPFTFLTEASVNLADDLELLEGMKQAGFKRVFLGIETPVEDSLKEVRKTQNTRSDLLESVKRIQSYGMEAMGGFIVGFDHDPEDIFERQIKFIRESAIPLAMVGLLNALPDTQLWKRLEREGRLLGDSSGNNVSLSLNFIPTMDPARLIEGYKQIVQTIYSPREYYQRALECLRRVVQDGPSQYQQGVMNGIAALTRITVKLGILDRERKEFWRYLSRVVTENREKFADSLRLAAMGYHLRKLAEAFGE
jgi:radical SAM superfamily enzyme YgiQ (UPF0313 family)